MPIKKHRRLSTRKRKNPDPVLFKKYFDRFEEISRSKKQKDLFINCISDLKELLKNSEFLEGNFQYYDQKYVPENFIPLGSGVFGDVYKIYLKKNLFIQNQIIKNNVYALKIYKTTLFTNCYNTLPIFSKLGIIPKIFLHNKCFTLMEFIEGYSLTQLNDMYDKGKLDKNIMIKLWKNQSSLIRIVESLIKKYPELPHVHLDIDKPDNYLVTKNLQKMYLIDPCY